MYKCVKDKEQITLDRTDRPIVIVLPVILNSFLLCLFELWLHSPRLSVKSTYCVLQLFREITLFPEGVHCCQVLLISAPSYTSFFIIPVLSNIPTRLIPTRLTCLVKTDRTPSPTSVKCPFQLSPKPFIIVQI